MPGPGYYLKAGQDNRNPSVTDPGSYIARVGLDVTGVNIRNNSKMANLPNITFGH